MMSAAHPLSTASASKYSVLICNKESCTQPRTSHHWSICHTLSWYFCRSVTYLVMRASSSLNAWASAGTLSPCGSRFCSVAASVLRISILRAISSWRSMVLATLSSGSIFPDASLISISSALADCIQPSIAFRLLSKLWRGNKLLYFCYNFFETSTYFQFSFHCLDFFNHYFLNFLLRNLKLCCNNLIVFPITNEGIFCLI